MAGSSIGPYRIDRELGAGGMGRVYAATLERAAAGRDAGDVVALKVIHPHLMESEGFFKRFLREAELGASIEHHNVVRTFDCDAIGGRHFLVMEYVEGQTLRDLGREMGQVPEALVRHVGHEIATGLHAVHTAGVVHRDLKPENVLITREHQVKVMDLGVARLTDGDAQLSRAGAFVGSYGYSAPEQFLGKGVDHRADLYALGVTLFELMAGRPPRQEPDLPAMMRAVLDDEPPRLGTFRADTTPFLEELVLTLLDRDPERRFASAAELAAVLAEGESSAWWRLHDRREHDRDRRPLRRLRLTRDAALRGRDDELGRLAAAFHRAESVEGAVVLVEGEAGIGKSRLVDEFVARLRRDEGEFDFLFGVYPPGGGATGTVGFLDALTEHFGDAGCGEHLRASPALITAFDALLRGEPAPAASVPLTPDSLATCMVHATRSLADVRPVVLLIDDLHFAPDAAKALFVALALAAAGHRMLLIGTTRHGLPPDWIANLTRLEHVEHLSLSRLGPKDLVALLHDAFGSERLAHELAGRIAVKSDGNPFFVFEIIRSLRDSGLIRDSGDGAWETTGVIESIEIPSSVLDLVNARVAKLDDDDRNLLDVAATGGFEFDPLLVGEVLGLPLIPTLQRFARIERKHRLIRATGELYTFDHHQVHELLRDGVHARLRQQYHAAFADLSAREAGLVDREPEAGDGAACVTIVRHLLRGTQPAAAARLALVAVQHLVARHQAEEAGALAREVLDGIPKLDAALHCRLLLRLISVYDTLGRRPPQIAAAQECERRATAAGELSLASEAACNLGWARAQTADYAAAETALERALALAREAGDRRLESHACGNLGLVREHQSRIPEARGLHETQARLAREIGDRWQEAAAAGNLALSVQGEGRIEEALELRLRALTLFGEVGDRRHEALATGNVGVSLAMLGRLDEARQHFERQLELARDLGDRPGEAMATGNLGGVHAHHGRLGQAVTCHRRHVELTRELGERRAEAIAQSNLATVLTMLGQTDEALECAERSLAFARSIGRQGSVARRLEVLADAAEAAGRDDDAERSWREALELRRALGDPARLAALSSVLGAALARRERHAAARALAEAALASCAADPAAVDARVLATSALVMGGGAASMGDLVELTSLLDARSAATSIQTQILCRLMLWSASGDLDALREARRLVALFEESAPPDRRASVVAGHALHRAIDDADKRAGIVVAGSETETRPGT